MHGTAPDTTYWKSYPLLATRNFLWHILTSHLVVCISQNVCTRIFCDFFNKWRLIVKKMFPTKMVLVKFYTKKLPSKNFVQWTKMPLWLDVKGKFMKRVFIHSDTLRYAVFVCDLRHDFGWTSQTKDILAQSCQHLFTTGLNFWDTHQKQIGLKMFHRKLCVAGRGRDF
mgnify:CR=1 FL=1